jgi:hypothetical protein
MILWTIGTHSGSGPIPLMQGRNTSSHITRLYHKNRNTSNSIDKLVCPAFLFLLHPQNNVSWVMGLLPGLHAVTTQSLRVWKGDKLRNYLLLPYTTEVLQNQSVDVLFRSGAGMNPSGSKTIDSPYELVSCCLFLFCLPPRRRRRRRRLVRLLLKQLVVQLLLCDVSPPCIE